MGCEEIASFEWLNASFSKDDILYFLEYGEKDEFFKNYSGELKGLTTVMFKSDRVSILTDIPFSEFCKYFQLEKKL